VEEVLEMGDLTEDEGGDFVAREAILDLVEPEDAGADC